MRVKVNVTSRDIKEGVPRDCENCAIARAIKKLVKSEYSNDVVITDYVQICGINYGRNSKIVNFVDKYDTERKETIKPISFVISIPKEYLNNRTIKNNLCRNS